MRVAKLDMTHSSQQCPGDLRLNVTSGLCTCVIDSESETCSSVTLNSIQYFQVCGSSYQSMTTDAFADHGLERPTNPGINDNYVCGWHQSHT